MKGKCRGLALAFAALATGAQAQDQVFHNGDHVLITPYGGAWAECTLTSDRLGYANDYSYMAVCAPMSASSTPDNRAHQYSGERVKSMNDPQAQAGIAQQRAIFGGPRGAPAVPGQQTYQPQYPQPAYAPPTQPQYPQPRQNAQPYGPQSQQTATQQSYQVPSGEGAPGLGPPPAMDAPARPGYGPAQ